MICDTCYIESIAYENIFQLLVAPRRSTSFHIWYSIFWLYLENKHKQKWKIKSRVPPVGIDSINMKG